MGLEDFSINRNKESQEPQISLDLDSDLIRRAQEGDQQALQALYQRYWRRILNYLYRFTGNRSMAEDLTQDTFFQVVRYLPRYRPIGSVGGWIYRIARNVALHSIRHRALIKEVSLDEPLELEEGSVNRADVVPSTDPKPDEAVGKLEIAELVQQTLLKVAPVYREVLILCDIEGYSYQSAADLLHCPINTIASRLARGRAQLAELLGYLRKEKF